MRPSKSSLSSSASASVIPSDWIDRRDLREVAAHRTGANRRIMTSTKPKDEGWYDEAKRLNDLLVELTPKPSRPGQEREDDTPAEVLGIVRQQQERHLGGVARVARGWLEGTLVQPHQRDVKMPLDGWSGQVIAARHHHQEHGKTDFPVYLENRKARRTWKKLNPFRVKKARVKSKELVLGS